MLKLKNSIWPEIRKILPQAKINIVGSYPPAKAIALNNPKQGFIVRGFVEDDFDAMQNARVHLAPLLSGAGVKSKCMLAFRAGTPTVTTVIGAEGLLPSNNWAGSIRQDDASFIEAAIKLYQTETEFTKAQANVAKILDNFFLKKWNPLLIKKLNIIKANLTAHRERNFTGQIMLHHQHLSTRYMAKWIEAKNKN